MGRFLRRALLAALATSAALGMYAWSTLPPRAEPVAGAARRPHVVAGAIHVHSSRSDGSGAPAEIAAAAARAGLQFVVLTDHGDLTRPPDPPAYHQGVLVIDAAEVSTDDGHVVALGVTNASPYPVAGATRDVLEDIRRLGGWAVVAHPDSPRAGLAARAPIADFDGLEWLNADSEWRRHGAGTLSGTLIRSIFRPSEAIAALFQAPRQTLRRWDAALRTRHVVAIAATDAHARAGVDHDAAGRAGRWRPAMAWPGYETMFSTVAQTVTLDSPPTGQAPVDAAALLTALRLGRSYSVVRAYADAADVLEFRARRADLEVTGGGHLPGGEPARFVAEARGRPDASVEIWRDGERAAAGRGRAEFEGGPGVYRVEVRLDGRDAPWVVSNPIRLGPALATSGEAPGTAGERGGAEASSAPVSILPGGWGLERDATSTATLTAEGPALVFQYRLGAGQPAGQYVALAARPGALPIGTIELTLSSTSPMRLSLQVRAPGEGDQRWRRSLYIDETPRHFVVPVGTLDPVTRGSSLRPIVARVDSLLLVVDTVNARTGSTGTVFVHRTAVRTQN